MTRLLIARITPACLRVFFWMFKWIQGSGAPEWQSKQREININVNEFLYRLGWKSWFALIFMHKNIHEIREVRRTTGREVICAL